MKTFLYIQIYIFGLCVKKVCNMPEVAIVNHVVNSFDHEYYTTFSSLYISQKHKVD